ncbi:MAG: hypothetical protein ACRC0V_07560 [Fusobacteriaceae bacterium]
MLTVEEEKVIEAYRIIKIKDKLKNTGICYINDIVFECDEDIYIMNDFKYRGYMVQDRKNTVGIFKTVEEAYKAGLDRKSVI